MPYPDPFVHPFSDAEAYRIERHPAVGEPAITVPPGWELKRITGDAGEVDEWLVYNARIHTTVAMPAFGSYAFVDTLVEEHGWKAVAVTAAMVIYLGPKTPAAVQTLQAVLDETVSYECFIRVLEIAASRRSEHCTRRRH